MEEKIWQGDYSRRQSKTLRVAGKPLGARRLATASRDAQGRPEGVIPNGAPGKPTGGIDAAQGEPPKEQVGPRQRPHLARAKWLDGHLCGLPRRGMRKRFAGSRLDLTPPAHALERTESLQGPRKPTIHRTGVGRGRGASGADGRDRAASHALAGRSPIGGGRPSLGRYGQRPNAVKGVAG